MSRLEILFGLVNLSDVPKDFQILETPPHPAQPFPPGNPGRDTEWKGTPRVERQRRREHVHKDRPR